ncbi:FAD-binding protein [Aeromicrobium senzhongii]|uniref:FAD-binding protein n=1 Tax=Aeromicrobium senzhongii TaxID=2663859 RepID=A0ABX6T2S6_9ACTN|nr:FAD-binding protein [Aeromicrobium senzhongii]MTB87161.1 FAD-binding protein [Aeromicrobium senzhongii]QNL95760.1 FAD-binding protein [Aeromicrobium senzhongii]
MDNKSFDLVVVGTGTGMLAALAAAEAGLSVLLVEKSEYVGGSTALSGGGFWVPSNPMLTEAGAEDPMSEATKYLAAVTRGEAPEARWKSFLSHGAEAVKALARLTPLKFGHMTDYADYFPELPGGSTAGRAMEPKPFNARKLGADRGKLRPPALEAPFPMPVSGTSYKWLNLVARTPRGIFVAARLLGMGVGGLAIKREYIAGGGALAAGLYAGVRARNIPVWLESPLKELIVEDDRVVGVVVQRDGKDISVRAKHGVILAAGGFDRNEAMRHAHQSEKLDTDWALGNPANTGDAITIAQGIGADLAFLEEAWWFPAVPIPGPMPGTLLAERSLPGQIIVNQAGERFMNEAVNYMSAGKDLLAQDLPVWMIFDQRYRNRYVFGGSIFPRQSFPKEWYDAGVVKKADSLEKLAADLGMPALPQSVQRFNDLCASGHDDDFGRGDSAYDRYYGDPGIKPNPCLGPIDKGPYYAVQVVPGDLGTCGGVKADEFGRALRPDGTTIEGLYAIGNAAGNAFGRVYPGPGATIAQGLVFGYIAANHAAGRLPD